VIVCLSAFTRTTSASSMQLLRRYCCHVTSTSHVKLAKEPLVSAIISCIPRVVSRLFTYSIRYVETLLLVVPIHVLSARTARPFHLSQSSTPCLPSRWHRYSKRARKWTAPSNVSSSITFPSGKEKWSRSGIMHRPAFLRRTRRSG
jgi:hypothetical protein